MNTLVLILVGLGVAILFFGMLILTTSMSSLGEVDEEPSFESRASTEDERF
jgi:hypothetical protein